MLEYYKDLDLALSPHPLTGDLNPKVNADAIKRALRHLFLLEKGDVPFESFIHGYTSDFLFELPTGLNEISLKDKIRWLIDTFEPRVETLDIVVLLDSQETGFDITVTYKIKTLQIEETLNFFIQRVR
jgi:hypothetical protein